MENTKVPFYAKVALIFVAAYAFVYALYIAEDILLPIVYSTILAILLNPFVNFLVKKKLPRILAITVAVVIVFIATAFIVYFAYSQISMFADTYPQLKVKVSATGNDGVLWVSKHFNIKIEKINAYIKDTEDNAFNNLGSILGKTLLGLSNTLFVMTLLPVYLFMILYYKTLLLEFIRRLFNSNHHTAVIAILSNVKGIIQSYLSGLLIEALIVATLNSLGLIILGLDYAIILGITGAMLNVIPYIGGVIAIALPMIIAFVTKDSLSYPLLVLVIYLVIQFIDNHFIIPRIVASKLK